MLVWSPTTSASRLQRAASRQVTRLWKMLQALQSSGLDAQAVRLSVGPSDGAPAPAASPEGGAIVPGAEPIPAGGSDSGSNTAAIAGGIVGGLAFGLLLAAVIWFWLVRRRRRRRQLAAEGANLAASGKGDIELASDTGSSSDGAYAGGGGPHPSCWPFNRRSAKQRPSGDSSSSRLTADSPGDMYGSKAFLANGTQGSAKADRPVYGQVHPGHMPAVQQSTTRFICTSGLGLHRRCMCKLLQNLQVLLCSCTPEQAAATVSRCTHMHAAVQPRRWQWRPTCSAQTSRTAALPACRMRPTACVTHTACRAHPAATLPWAPAAQKRRVRAVQLVVSTLVRFS